MKQEASSLKRCDLASSVGICHGWGQGLHMVGVRREATHMRDSDQCVTVGNQAAQEHRLFST